MKKLLFTITILFLGLSMDAQTINATSHQASDLVITQNQIKEDGKLIGKYEVKKKELKNSKNEKVKYFEVEISGKDGIVVADYEVTINKDTKSNRLSVTDAQMKTLKDRVTHNGANFLDYALAKDMGDSEV